MCVLFLKVGDDTESEVGGSTGATHVGGLNLK